MAFVVTEPCIKCRYTDCVKVCPVDCFHVGPDMLVINPDECIDCGVCQPECPVQAIMPDFEDSEGFWTAYNKHFSSIWPNQDRLLPPLPSAELFKDVHHKRELLTEKFSR